MRLNGFGGGFHVAQIGFAVLVQRRGHADNDGVGFLELGEIRGGVEVAAVHILLNLGLLDVFDVRLAGIEQPYFFRIGIKAGDFVAGLRETQGQGKTHVTATDDGHLERGPFEKFRFSVRRHEMESAPVQMWLSATPALRPSK